MSKSNSAEKNAVAEVAEVKTVEAVAAPVMTIVKNEAEEPRKLTLDEKIQKVEDLTLMIDRWRTLSESRRKLQTFQIGADSLSSVILLRDAAGNEFKTKTYEFDYKNRFGLKEQFLFSVHFTLAGEHELPEIFKKAQKWYCDYLTWEDLGISDDQTAFKN